MFSFHPNSLGGLDGKFVQLDASDSFVEPLGTDYLPDLADVGLALR